MEDMKKIIYYIFVPVILYTALVGVLFYVTCWDLKSAIEWSAIIIQSLAIIIGGFWAYRKFGWEKKCENIITLKAVLMEFSHMHNLSAVQYRIDNDIIGYKTRLITPYNELLQKIHLSYYVSEKLRKKIFDTIWLTIGNDTGQNFEKINENWTNFEKQLKEIYDEFDKIISI